jgi:hypothetical protein
MSVAVFLALCAPALLVPLLRTATGRYLADHLRPSWTAALLTAALAGFATTTLVGLGLLVAVGVTRWDPALADRTWSLAALAGDRPAVVANLGVALGVLAAAAVVLVALRVGRVLRRLGVQYGCARALVPVRARRGSVIEMSGAPFAAQALPVRGGHVLVDAATWACLPDRYRGVVLAHERSHLRHRHDLHLALAALASACNPLVVPLARALSYALERWADEDAAAGAGRCAVAHAVGAVALADVGPVAPVLGVSGGVVPRRVGALVGAAAMRTSSWRGTLLAVVVVATLVGAAGVAQHAWVDLLESLETR